MNYNWKKLIEEGQKTIGFLEVYETNVENIKIKAIINYLSNLDQFSNNKICNVTIIYACEKQDITDGIFHCVSDDICELITDQENIKFNKVLNKFETMFTQHFFLKELPKMTYFTHGDYSIS